MRRPKDDLEKRLSSSESKIVRERAFDLFRTFRELHIFSATKISGKRLLTKVQKSRKLTFVGVALKNFDQVRAFEVIKLKKEI